MAISNTHIDTLAFQGDFRVSEILPDLPRNKLSTSGFLTSPQGRVMRSVFAGINSLDQFRDRQRVDLISEEYSEPTHPELGASDLTFTSAVKKSIYVKASYITKGWLWSSIFNHAYKDFGVEELIKDKARGFLGEYLDHLIAAQLKSLSFIPELNSGDGTTKLTLDLYQEAEAKLGDLSMGDNSVMFMSPTTLLYNKEANGLIKPIEIRATLAGGGSELQKRAEYKFNEHHPIVKDETLEDGLVVLLIRPPFIFDYTNRVVNSSDRLTDGDTFWIRDLPYKSAGIGERQLGIRFAFGCYPIGCSFNGQKGTDFQKTTGPSVAEYATTGMFELIDSPKRVGILTFKVKFKD